MISGHIYAEMSLQMVRITKGWESTSLFADTIRDNNVKEYDFSYLVTGITDSTIVYVEAFAYDAGYGEGFFLIKPYH
jgi:hypothetical protein